jgi:hypothetical protein
MMHTRHHGRHLRIKILTVFLDSYLVIKVISENDTIDGQLLSIGLPLDILPIAGI